MARQSQDSIEALSEVLGLLRITEEYISEEQNYKPVILETKEMLIALVSWCAWTLIFSFIYFS